MDPLRAIFSLLIVEYDTGEHVVFLVLLRLLYVQVMEVGISLGNLPKLVLKRPFHHVSLLLLLIILGAFRLPLIFPCFCISPSV